LFLFLTFPVAEPIFFGCDGVQDSPKKTDFCGVCDGDNSTCTDCQGYVRPGLVNNKTCGTYIARALLMY
jgi:hypothetical protein